MEPWTGSAAQLLWFAGLTRREQNHICTALITGSKLLWDSKELEGVLIKA